MSRIFKHNPERDACGIGGIALKSVGQQRSVVDQTLHALSKLQHRGGSLCRSEATPNNPKLFHYDGDGTGILLQIPRLFFLREAEKVNPYLKIEDPTDIAVGVFFYMGREKDHYLKTRDEIEHEFRSEGFLVIGWREVPVKPSVLSEENRRAMPKIDHLLILRYKESREDFERRLYYVRKKIRRDFLLDRREIYVASLSSRTMVYKGRLTCHQFLAFYPDILDDCFETGMIIFHHRFSTNTYPHWYIAQPFRMLCHNGEINTISANRHAVFAYYNQLKTLEPPVVSHDESDSSTLDHWLEEQIMVGNQSLLLSLRLTFPPAWEKKVSGLSHEEHHLYEFYKSQKAGLGIWDGPAGILAMDGDIMVAGVDRMGLRPVRWGMDENGTFFASTETGAFAIPEKDLTQHRQLGPGEMVALDQKGEKFLFNHDIVPEIQKGIGRCSYIRPKGPPDADSREPTSLSANAAPFTRETLDRLLATHGWTQERADFVRHMAETGQEPVASTGFDKPLPVFSTHHPTIYKYFHQTFAQVTNPPIDPIREGSAIDISVYIGEKVSSFSPDYIYSHDTYQLHSPVLTPKIFRKVTDIPDFNTQTFDLFFGEPGELRDAGENVDKTRYWGMRLKDTLHHLMDEVSKSVEDGCCLAILSHAANSKGKQYPIPSLLALATVNEKLRRTGMKDKVDLLVVGADIQEGHDVAALIAFGASIIHPYLIYETASMAEESRADALTNIAKAMDFNLKKVMSKMGITTFYGYQDSKLFESVGLNSEVMRFFGKPAIAVEGLGLGDIAMDSIARVDLAAGAVKLPRDKSPHAYNPRVVKALAKAAETNKRENFQKFTSLVDHRTPISLRDMLEIKYPDGKQIDGEDVESPEEIIRKYFRGAAMSHGALKKSAHQDIAAAFNSFHSLSNSGEGGEDSNRGKNGENSPARSRIRQVASGRFGVDTVFLVNADEIHIKMAQGAKPGEGGQLPGRKVDKEIADNRFTQPGVELISPPPHHDIYSIEDLTQLIYDLKSVNPGAKISVKLTSGAHIGVIATGVAKAGADIIEIDGFDGGTGAALASSKEHAGLPLETGLVDTHSALLENGLRKTVKIRVGGGIKTAKDVLKLALLGADEFSFGTALMVALGCIMCRKCHIPDCSTGISGSQGVYKGNHKKVRNYLLHVAEGVRDQLADMGKASLRQIVGKSNFLTRISDQRSPRGNKLNLEALLTPVPTPEKMEVMSNSRLLTHEICHGSVNRQIINTARDSLEGESSRELVIRKELTNRDRAVGATLAGIIAMKYGRKGFPGLITCRFQGQAGQSFGAFMTNGTKLILEGTAEDGVGKGMSGGRLIVRSSGARPANLPHQSLAGNNVCYGATGGECFIGGNAGQRLGIRNSGATIITIGAGKYACEYMTGGIVVAIGEVEDEIGAGMTGGVGYFRDMDEQLRDKIQKSNVGLHDCDKTDHQTLLDLLNTFHFAVKTDYVKTILADWEREKMRFRKVMPGGRKSN